MEDKLHYSLGIESGLLNRVPRSPLTSLAPFPSFQPPLLSLSTRGPI